MRDMLEVLRRAKHKKTFADQEEFEEALAQIQAADKTLKIDWDDGAGEEWARFSDQTDGTVCMINSKIRVAFVRSKYRLPNIQHLLCDYEVVLTEDFCSDEWTIDLDKLKHEIPEIYWHTSEDAVNINHFSLDDLYFATV